MTDDGFDFGGTADLDYVFNIIGFSTDIDLMERNRYIRECWLFLHEKLGAVLDVGGWRILYWQVGKQSLFQPVVDRRPLVIRAGFMSQSRGRHWKRNNSK